MKNIALLAFIAFFSSAVFAVEKTDHILSLETQPMLGTQQAPRVYIELTVKKRRDLHVALKNVANPSDTLKKIMKPIKKSGKYHFDVDVTGLKPGKYRFDAYLAPRKKDWNDRVGNTQRVEFEVVDKPVYKKPVGFSSQDALINVTFPKVVVGNAEQTLFIKYDITEPRELHIRLLSSDNWAEFGSLKFPVSEPGQISLPIVDMTDDFPAGKYAWVIHLAAVGDPEPIVKKWGKHFELKAN